MANPSCDGPVAYVDRSLAEADIANLRPPAGGATEVFMSAASPGVIEMFMANRYYPSTEEYLFALADAMKQEYDAIGQAGLVLQLDCPDLAANGRLGPEQTTAEFRRVVAQRLEALDYATRDIPPDRLRMHLCWATTRAPTTPMSPWPTSSTWCWRPGPRRCRSRRPTPAMSTSGRCSKRSSCPRARS